MWSLLSKVGEIVAPSVQSSLDDFKREWRGVRAFYIDKKQDVIEGQIPQLLNNMIQMLLEEEDRHRTADIGGAMGPCLDFFLRERILGFWCKVSMLDVPKGMRKLTLTSTATLLRNLRSQALIAQQSVHEPLAGLLTACCEKLPPKAAASAFTAAAPLDMTATIEVEEYVALVATIVDKLRELPGCLVFFVPLQQSGQPCPLLDTLFRFLDDTSAVGGRARMALQQLLSIPEAREYVLQHTELVDMLVAAVAEEYAMLCRQQYSVGTSVTRQHLAMLRLCASLLDPSDALSAALLSELEDQVFHSVLIPDVQSKQESEALAATLYAADVFRHQHAVLLSKSLATFLLGSDRYPEECGVPHESESTRTLLAQRISSGTSHALKLASARLLLAVLEVHNRDIVANVCLRNLGTHFGDAKAPKADAEAVLSQMETIVSFSPFTTLETMMTSRELDSYVRDGLLGCARASTLVSEWKETEQPITPSKGGSGAREEFYAGSLLEAALAAVSCFSDPTSGAELMACVAGIVTVLLRMPIPQISAYLLATPTHACFGEGSPSFLGKLQETSAQLRQVCAQVPEMRAKLSIARQQMLQPHAISKYFQADSTAEPQGGVVECAVLFDEFLKELEIGRAHV